MSSVEDAGSRVAVDLFCRQCLQLEPYKDLDWPSGAALREEEAQKTLYDALCGGARPLPVRYRLRVLKELTRRIEEGIEDWDLHVSLLDLSWLHGSEAVSKSSLNDVDDRVYPTISWRP